MLTETLNDALKIIGGICIGSGLVLMTVFFRSTTKNIHIVIPGFLMYLLGVAILLCGFDAQKNDYYSTLVSIIALACYFTTIHSWNLGESKKYDETTMKILAIVIAVFGLSSLRTASDFSTFVPLMDLPPILLHGIFNYKKKS